MRTLAICTLVSLVALSGAPSLVEATAKKQPVTKRPKVKRTTKVRTGGDATAGKTLRPKARRSPFKRGTASSGYRREAYGKDETPDVAAHEQADYHAWRDSAMHDMALADGGHAPVALVEVGRPGVNKPTIVHFHGATVQLENVLVWRLARAAKAEGKPVRIIAARYQDADRIINELTRDGGKVAVMGHSAGSGTAQSVARRNEDKVSHYIGIGGPGSAGPKVKTLLLNGTNGRDGWESAKSLAERDSNVTSLVLEGVDHSMRQAPAGLGGGQPKAEHNASPETARVARRVVRSVVDFVTAKPGGFFSSVQGSWQGRFDEAE